MTGSIRNISKAVRAKWPFHLVWAFGTLYIQAEEGYTDEQTRRNIQENPYLQYFCGFECYTMESPFDASMMTHFRKRISPEMIQRSTIWFLRQKQLPARIIPRKMIP